MTLEKHEEEMLSRASEHRDGLADRIRQVARFTLPYLGKVAVISEGNADLLDLEGRKTWHLPQTKSGVYAGPFPVNDADAIKQLEAVRAEGAQYLLIPKTSFWWLEHYEGLRRHLAEHYRVVVREEDACMIIALHEEVHPDLREEGAPDGLPLPPPEMVAMVILTYGAKGLLKGGARITSAFRKALERNGISPDRLHGILDFGCGCGRVIRFWRDVSDAGLFGVDYNPYFVDWCQKTLPFATFQRNSHWERLDYRDGSFGLIYSYSVFTHLDVDSQFFWMNELNRVLRPGGFLLLTVHGTAYVHELPSEEQGRFVAGEVVVKEADYSGSSGCAAFHPKEYVRDVLASDLELIDFVPGGPEVEGTNQLQQDILLFRKPTG